MKGEQEVASSQLNEALLQLEDLLRQNARSDMQSKEARIQQAHRELSNRAAEKRHFKPGVISEASWRMLLDLYIAEHQKVRVSVTSLCIASDEPQTTALRWIALLEESGYITKEADQSDARRKFVALTDKGKNSLDRFFMERPFQLI